MSINATGAFVVTWSSNGEAVAGKWGVYAREYDSSGNPLSNEFQVSPTSSFDQMYSTRCHRQQWQRAHQLVKRPGSTGSGSKWMVYGQQFAPNGSLLGTRSW